MRPFENNLTNKLTKTTIMAIVMVIYKGVSLPLKVHRYSSEYHNLTMSDKGLWSPCYSRIQIQGLESLTADLSQYQAISRYLVRRRGSAVFLSPSWSAVAQEKSKIKLAI